MALPPIYSRRKRQREAPGAEIFTYDSIPPNVRVQLYMNMSASIDAVSSAYKSREEFIREIVEELREEIGTNNLTGKYNQSLDEELEFWFYNDAQTEQILDALELWCLFANYVAERGSRDSSDRHKQAVAKVNAWLLEASIGFELVDGRVIEKSSEFLHKEAVLPALHVLADIRFKNANEEFRGAHSAYRAAEYEDCITDCLKALESVIKVIAAERKWALSDNATASRLIGALFDNDFVPSYMRSQFDGLRALLESSVPTTRNKSGGHGKGTQARTVPSSLAALQIHQTAAIIVFLSALDV